MFVLKYAFVEDLVEINSRITIIFWTGVHFTKQRLTQRPRTGCRYGARLLLKVTSIRPYDVVGNSGNAESAATADATAGITP